MSAHTPGPWYVVMSGGSPWIEAEGPTSIAHAMPIRGGEANAELIAAAPELLASARAFLAKWKLVRPAIDSAFLLQQVHGGRYDGPTLERELDQLSAAIAKAEGR